MKQLQFIDEHGSFTVENPEQISGLYFPLGSEAGLKSSITPNLGGDAKINQESFLIEPVSIENLHNNRASRNFWCAAKNGAYSAAGASAEQEAAKFTERQDKNRVTAGLMWHTLERSSDSFGLLSRITSFVPVNENVEIMHILIRNISDSTQEITPYAAVPIYGRSADNLRDHRHVTSLLHRIKTTENGVLVCPTMSFDERGHQRNHRIYYVLGCTGEGEPPVSFYPTVEDFLGEGGTYTHPRAVFEQFPGVPAFAEAAGKEAMGAFRFESVSLAPGEQREYIVLIGAEDEETELSERFCKYHTSEKVLAELARTKDYWIHAVNVGFSTNDADFDRLMKWISFQPFLRRLFGCSFLPHHDYGRGGRGWRDLWQDCLSLLIMEPDRVGEMIVKNYGGVRIDGTNATIIGDGDGNFIADRNGIARVWMDHAFWPLVTTCLYIDQTGNADILTRQVPYFKDGQTMRGSGVDSLWTEQYGSLQKTVGDTVYTGTILEHLLIQQLTAFHDVGSHNICRMHGADWNDALDMAEERGESVAFTCAYAGALMTLANLILLLDSRHPGQEAEILEELSLLLNTDPDMFSNVSQKQEILAEYTSHCKHDVSGRHIRIPLTTLAANLIQKAAWLTEHIQTQEWIEGGDGEGWFNSYYDNQGNAVEGFFPDHVRMMLTGQVFAVMGSVATDTQIQKIIRSADHYLYRPEIGGYRLNTDFHELKFDLGRMFGFAYGEKENGAVFSHMTVMYANALYRRGYAKEGWKALKTLANTALDFDTGRIYPGIPEYFRSDGRGMYHYLTGAASWYMLTMVTEAFGVRGASGDLIFYPKLLAEQFADDGTASIRVDFAGKHLCVTYQNKEGKDYGEYIVESAACEGAELMITENSYAVLPREALMAYPDMELRVTVTLA